MVYGQLNADFGDRDIPHNARAGDVERLRIAADQIRFIKGIGGGVQLPVVRIGSIDAAITGGKCLDCRCISVICLAILKTEYDDEPLSAAQRFFFFR